MRGILLSLFILAFAVLGLPAVAQERILSFDAVITVNPDASLDVTETIRVVAEGNQIRRGIFRDIPMRRLMPSGLWDRNGFALRAVRHNGASSAYHTEWIGDFIRIYIGDADTFIPRGEHEYEIVYNTTRQLRFFDGFDELYWNVTGNFWTFPILKAGATVKLPAGASAERIAAYTGGFGETGSDYDVSTPDDSTVRFATTRRLAPNEGLSVAVGFTKGVVAESEFSSLLTNLWANAGAILFGIGWLAVPLYYLYAWLKVGRDPPAETVIPLFHPPANLSPAAMSYVHFKAFRRAGRGSDLAFIAALLSMGVKKLLVIEEDERGKVTFRRGTGGAADPARLPGGERSLYSSLLGSRDSIALEKANGTTLQKALQGMQSAIRTEYAGKFYRHNWGWFVPGVVLAALALFGGMILQQPPDEGVAAIVPALFVSLIGSGLILFGWRNWTAPAPGILTRPLAVFMIALGVLAIGFGFGSVINFSSLPVYQIGAGLMLAGILTIALMIQLLGAPTFEGAKVLPRIEGFKLYLETAETNRLNMRDAPEMSEELFERFLPYAAGLGVEEPWSKAFAAHLARVAPDRPHDYHPGWYSGRNWDSRTIGQAVGASAAAVSAAMASAMPQPKSTSGSSGGGFSGGGGGGGGGGGW